MKKRIFLTFFFMLIMCNISLAYSQTMHINNSIEDLTLFDIEDFGIGLVKFEMGLPETVENITDATLCLFVEEIKENPSDIMNISRINNQTWDETGLVGDLDNMDYVDEIELNVSPIIELEYKCFNVTDYAITEFNNGSDNLSVMFELYPFEYNRSSVSKSDVLIVGHNKNPKDSYHFEDSENHLLTNNTPYLNITYDYDNTTHLFIDSPTNTTYFRYIGVNASIPLNYHLIGFAENCTYNLTDGITTIFENISTNITLSVGEGSWNLSMQCDQDEIIKPNASVSFTVETICVENWIRQISDCVDGVQFITYFDLNDCGTVEDFDSLYPPNATYVDCNEDVFASGDYLIQYKSYPYFLVNENPQSIFVELNVDGQKSIAPNLTVTFIDRETLNEQVFIFEKNVGALRYELYIDFNISEIDHDFDLYFMTDYAGVGIAEGEMFIRNITCNLDFYLWYDINQSSAYTNEFGYVVARKIDGETEYTLGNYLLFTPIYDMFIGDHIETDSSDWFGENYTIRTDLLRQSADEWLYAEYVDGHSNMTLYDSGSYEIKFIDGSFIFFNNYGKFLIEQQGIDVDLGIYDLNCDSSQSERRDYFVSPFETDFQHKQGMFWLIFIFVVLSLVGGIFTMVVFRDVRIAGMVFVGILSVLVSVFLGVNIFKLLL